MAWVCGCTFAVTRHRRLGRYGLGRYGLGRYGLDRYGYYCCPDIILRLRLNRVICKIKYWVQIKAGPPAAIKI